MSRLEAWLDSVARTVQAGNEFASVVTLEGPDGTTWGTWPIDREKLAVLKNTIGAALEMIGEELATGRHAAKLIAVGADGKQLALLPTMIVGRSSVAASHGTEQRAMQQAVSLAVGNFEAMTLGLRQENERLRLRNEALEDRLAEVTETALGIQRAAAELHLEVAKAEARERRMAEVFDTAKPLLEVGMSFAGEWLVAKAESAKQAATKPTDAKPGKPRAGQDEHKGLALTGSTVAPETSPSSPAPEPERGPEQQPSAGDAAACVVAPPAVPGVRPGRSSRRDSAGSARGSGRNRAPAKRPTGKQPVKPKPTTTKKGK